MMALLSSAVRDTETEGCCNMENGEGPDQARRKQLLIKLEELIGLCSEIIRVGASSSAQGQRLTSFEDRLDRLSPQAKALFCEFGVSRERAAEIDATEGPNLKKWLKDEETEEYPIPDEFAEIMGLIDRLWPSAG